MTFWRWLTTSRYTRSLEEQVAELKQELAFERQQVRELTVKLAPTMDNPYPLNAKRSGTDEDKEKDKKPPQFGNWLRARPQLETQGVVVREADKEN